MDKRGGGPVDDDDEGEQQTPEGIEPPYPRVESDYREEDGADVEDDVGLGIVGSSGLLEGRRPVRERRGGAHRARMLEFLIKRYQTQTAPLMTTVEAMIPIAGAPL